MDEQMALDLDALRAHLDAVRPGMAKAALTAELLAGGHSNLTYAVSDGAQRWVLRRPPLGHTDATTHDMAREYRVMAALAGGAVPVPPVVIECLDPSVLGAPFYLSEFVDGTVHRTFEQTATLGPDRARALSFELVEVLADLHGLDPGSVGLGDFGRPEGFLERQVTRWTGLAEDALSDVSGVDQLVSDLRGTQPQTTRSSIVHGDYRLDNVMVSAAGRIVAVLDWEMAALGDPLTDLGLLHCYWTGVVNPGGDEMRKGIDPALGFPDFTELAERYATRSGMSLEALPWYAAFGYLKLAVLRGRIHQRFLAGNTPPGFDTVGELIRPLVTASRHTLEGT